ncbi:hypothetical protein GOP47_0026177 [Adiantum capillus-veneris]|uniref:Uncharacterized protein n=1 Tax=Adiantum capillus-veneris TaxID=13818 RepID=A0A9D4Z2N5_ADICA|nr:hypothetical protein GOP47_0026177 [Adiantum capillus-veneris]
MLGLMVWGRFVVDSGWIFGCGVFLQRWFRSFGVLARVVEVVGGRGIFVVATCSSSIGDGDLGPTLFATRVSFSSVMDSCKGEGVICGNHHIFGGTLEVIMTCIVLDQSSEACLPTILWIVTLLSCMISQKLKCMISQKLATARSPSNT